MTQTVILYRATFQKNYHNPKAAPQVVICSAEFERKPKSWRRVNPNTDGGSEGFGYGTIWRSDEAPGFDTPDAALKHLIEETKARISRMEEALTRAHDELAAAELF